MIQAYDVKRKRIVNVEKMNGKAIVSYSLPGKPSELIFPLIENGKNTEPYEILPEQEGAK